MSVTDGPAKGTCALCKYWKRGTTAGADDCARHRRVAGADTGCGLRIRGPRHDSVADLLHNRLAHPGDRHRYNAAHKPDRFQSCQHDRQTDGPHADRTSEAGK